MNLPWTVIVFLLGQLAAAVIWGASEHAHQQELERRLNMHLMDNRRETDLIEEQINRIEYSGTRVGQIIAERQVNVLRRLDALEMKVNSLSQR